MSVTLSDIQTAARRISSHVHRTQVLTSKTFDELAGGKQLFFKCENFQKTGSFKARGIGFIIGLWSPLRVPFIICCNHLHQSLLSIPYQSVGLKLWKIYATKKKVFLPGALNGILSVVERGEKPRMIVTHSSGNHGQAVAWAAARTNIPCTIVVPSGTPTVKVRAINPQAIRRIIIKPETSISPANISLVRGEGRLAGKEWDATGLRAEDVKYCCNIITNQSTLQLSQGPDHSEREDGLKSVFIFQFYVHR